MARGGVVCPEAEGQPECPPQSWGAQRSLPLQEGKTPAFHSHGTAPPPQSAPRHQCQPGPLTFFEHSVSLLSPLAGPDLPLGARRAMFPLSSVPMGGELKLGGGREESPIVPQPSWAVWTQADSQCQGENSPPSRPGNRPIVKIGLLPIHPQGPLSLRTTMPVCSTLHAHRHHAHRRTHTRVCTQSLHPTGTAGGQGHPQNLSSAPSQGNHVFFRITMGHTQSLCHPLRDHTPWALGLPHCLQDRGHFSPGPPHELPDLKSRALEQHHFPGVLTRLPGTVLSLGAAGCKVPPLSGLDL